MSATWYGEAPPPETENFGFAGWIRVLMKGSALGVLVFGGLVILLLLRLIERPFFRQARPVTPHITVFVCHAALRIIGLKLVTKGSFVPGAGAIVANHSSWLDIFVLNALKPVYFVSKAEVAGWPGIGWLARATGTVFIERSRTKAADQSRVFQNRLNLGHRLLFFPEGTSSDGLRVLPFKTSLFSAFFTDALKPGVTVQPVSVIYRAPQGCDARMYGWWGDMEFADHFLTMLAAPAQGTVAVTYHTPLKVADFDDRKVLAFTLEQSVRAGHEALIAR